MLSLNFHVFTNAGVVVFGGLVTPADFKNTIVWV